MKRSGYTLKELIMVLTVFTILASVALPIMMNVTETTPRNKTMGLIQLMQQGCERYKLEDPSGAYPSPGGNDGDESWIVLYEKLCMPRVSGKAPPMLAGRPPTDAWGRPLRYLALHGANLCRFRSAGPNGIFDDDDDIDATDGYEPSLAP